MQTIIEFTWNSSMITSKQIYFVIMRSLLSHEVIIWYTSQRMKNHQKSLNVKLRSVQERALWQIINIYHATSIETLQMKTNMMLINIHLWKLIQRSIININSWKSSEVIEMTMRWIHNDLISKRDQKSKLYKTFLQLKRKWMKETFKQMKMNQSHLYTVTFWSKSLKIVIVANKKMSIKQHNLDIIASKQKVYLNNNNSRNNVTVIMMRMNWKLNKRLKKLTLIITHHDELKELVAKTKHFTDVVIIRLFWKQWKLWYQQKIKHVCNEFKLRMRAFNLKKSRWSYIEWQNMQKYLKMKQWTRWLMMHMICLYCWLSINALKWWQDWRSYRNRSDKHEE